MPLRSVKCVKLCVRVVVLWNCVGYVVEKVSAGGHTWVVGLTILGDCGTVIVPVDSIYVMCNSLDGRRPANLQTYVTYT
jgi:hypothetical protein